MAEVKPKSERNRVLLLNNPQMINEFFAQISTDPEYVPGDITKHYCCPNSNRAGLKSNNFRIDGYQMERLLLHLKKSSPGLDNIPCWVFCKCSIELADVIYYKLFLYFWVCICTIA